MNLRISQKELFARLNRSEKLTLFSSMNTNFVLKILEIWIKNDICKIKLSFNYSPKLILTGKLSERDLKSYILSLRSSNFILRAGSRHIHVTILHDDDINNSNNNNNFCRYLGGIMEPAD